MRVDQVTRRRRGFRVEREVRQGGTQERRAASRRRITRTTAMTSNTTSNHNAVFAAAANAMPVGEDGAERNGPPSTNHQTVTPGSTKSERGLRITDGMVSGEPSADRTAALTIASTAAAKNQDLRLTGPMGVPTGCRLSNGTIADVQRTNGISAATR